MVRLGEVIRTIIVRSCGCTSTLDSEDRALVVQTCPDCLQLVKESWLLQDACPKPQLQLFE